MATLYGIARNMPPLLHSPRPFYSYGKNTRAVVKMIIGIGTDLVEIRRIEGLLERHPERALARLFTPIEHNRCQRVKHASRSYAARFAAKEAVFKALGTGWGRGPRWTDIEVHSAESGMPTLRLSGRALELARGMGVTELHLSLTHTEEYAGAFVVMEGERQ